MKGEVETATEIPTPTNGFPCGSTIGWSVRIPKRLSEVSIGRTQLLADGVAYEEPETHSR